MYELEDLGGPGPALRLLTLAAAELLPMNPSESSLVIAGGNGPGSRLPQSSESMASQTSIGEAPSEEAPERGNAAATSNTVDANVDGGDDGGDDGGGGGDGGSDGVRMKRRQAQAAPLLEALVSVFSRALAAERSQYRPCMRQARQSAGGGSAAAAVPPPLLQLKGGGEEEHTGESEGSVEDNGGCTSDNSGGGGSSLAYTVPAGAYPVTRLLTQAAMDHFRTVALADPPTTVLESDHPYSAMSDDTYPMVIPGANRLFITFDARCRVHADAMTSLSFYRDPQCSELLHRYSGGAVRGQRSQSALVVFEPLVVEADRCYMRFRSGPGSEWGYRLVCTPMKLRLRDAPALAGNNLELATFLLELVLAEGPAFVLFECVSQCLFGYQWSYQSICQVRFRQL